MNPSVEHITEESGNKNENYANENAKRVDACGGIRLDRIRNEYRSKDKWNKSKWESGKGQNKCMEIIGEDTREVDKNLVRWQMQVADACVNKKEERG